MHSELEKLVSVCSWMNAQGYSPATSGNYSIRKDGESCYVSISGVDKSKLKTTDFMSYHLDYTYPEFVGKKPSDEAPIHARIYAMYPEANCVLHSHSVTNTVLSLADKSDQIEFKDFELLKAFSGVKTHAEAKFLTVVENTQDIIGLAKTLSASHDLPGILVRGHGIYVWGKDVDQAKRHLEAIEFLMSCKLELMRL